MPKSTSHGFILIIAFFLAAFLYMNTYASARDVIFNDPFNDGVLVFDPLQQGECRYLETDEANKWCVQFCEYLDCDETDYSGPGQYNKQIRKACVGLVRRYDTQTGVPGPPCICDEVCNYKHRKCLNRCDPEDTCCPTKCGNDLGQCKKECCAERAEIDYQMCLEDCGNDPDCLCLKMGCSFGPVTCIPPPLP